MKREKLLGSFRKAVPFGANKKSPPPPGKSPREESGVGSGLG